MVKKLVAIALLGLASLSANAGDYGCKVLMCLSNPAGPMAVQECVPPITRFFNEQAMRRPPPFPECDEANSGGQGGNFARLGNSAFDLCPEGTVALPAGATGVVGTAESVRAAAANPALAMQGMQNLQIYTGIGDDDGGLMALMQANGMGAGVGYKACVGNKLGSMPIFMVLDGTPAMGNVDVYDHIALLDMKASSRVVDIYLNNKIYRRVRW